MVIHHIVVLDVTLNSGKTINNETLIDIMTQKCKELCNVYMSNMDRITLITYSIDYKEQFTK